MLNIIVLVRMYVCHVICICTVMKQGKKEDAVLFAELHRRMSSQGAWHNGWAILHLLLVLSDEHAVSPAHSIVSKACICTYVYVYLHLCVCVCGCTCERTCVYLFMCDCVYGCKCFCTAIH